MASDSEGGGGGKFMYQAIYFEDSGEEFDLSLPPTTGHEYLRRVQLEAQQCPSVMYAKIDQSDFAAKQTVKYDSGKGCLSAPEGYAPTKSWQKSQIADFAEMRLVYFDLSEALKGSLPSTIMRISFLKRMSRYKEMQKQKNATTELPDSLPNILDDVGWCRFCFGSKEQKESGQSEDDGIPPLLSIVTPMSQPLIEQVLDYHMNWLETSGFTVRQGQWFYALLICLEKPLTPEACSSIRTLARLCANLRASLEKDDKIHLEGQCSSRCLSTFPYHILDGTWMYERLMVSCNCLLTVPPELPFRVPHLTHLDLDYNHLSSLPNSFSLFVHLQTLLLRHNSLETLPSSLVRLPRLSKLDLSYNRLTELPPDLGTMPRLSKLNVSNNKLTELPLSLGRSPHLVTLLAQGNSCRVPPQDLCDTGTSKSVIEFLRKTSVSLYTDCINGDADVELNVFPRVCGNDAMSLALNPHSLKSQYVKAQTDTTHTASRVKTPLLPPPQATAFSMDQLGDKIVGLIYGAVIGDALGIGTEFMTPDECKFQYDVEELSYENMIRDEHTVHWERGEWTSNSDQMFLVLDSVLHWAGMVDELDFAQRLAHWKNHGFTELNESGEYMLSETINEVLKKENYVTDPHGAAAELLTASKNKSDQVNDTQSHDRLSKDQILCCDNGSLSRALILGVPQFHNLKEVVSNSVRICLATHADERCVAASVAISVLVALILQGRYEVTSKSELDKMIQVVVQNALDFLASDVHRKEFESYMSMRDLESIDLHEKGMVHYVFKPLAAAVVALRSQEDCRTSLSKVILKGGHGTFNGCVAGAVLGCVTGYSSLPKDWVEGLSEKHVTWLNANINGLLDMMGLP